MLVPVSVWTSFAPERRHGRLPPGRCCWPAVHKLAGCPQERESPRRLSAAEAIIEGMAICSECSQEMTTATTCRDWRVRLNGRLRPGVPYGKEGPAFWDDDGWDDNWDDDWEDDRRYDEVDEEWLRQVRAAVSEVTGAFAGPPGGPRPPRRPVVPTPIALPDRCGDCGVRRGGHHHLGCDLASCPDCGGQLISCGCWDGATDADSAP